MNGRKRRFAGLKDLIHDNVRQGLSAGLTVLGDLVKPAKQLLDDDPLVTLQCGKAVVANTSRNMRTELWMSSLHRKGIGVAAAEKYDDMLLQRSISDEAATDIDKDLARTFPSMRRFASRDGQEALRRVLLAYAAYDPEVGYCQGMNFVAGLLLMYLPERHAFGGLVVLMQDRGLRKYYSTDMSLLQTHLWQLGRLMPQRLCAHLEACGVLPLLYGASWLMTCFSADFPASFSARVMDVIMADKMDQALLKAAVGLLKHTEQQLLKLHDMEDILQLLKLQLPSYNESILHDVLTDAFKVSWSSQQLQLLGSTEGAESVAEALQRVQRANKAAAAGTAGDAIAADLLPTAATTSRPPTAGSGDTASPVGNVLGTNDADTAAGFRLMPPPSPRPLSRTPTQRGYDSDRGVGIDRSLGSDLGNSSDRGFAGPWSEGGSTLAVADLLGPEHTVGGSSIGPAVRTIGGGTSAQVPSPDRVTAEPISGVIATGAKDSAVDPTVASAGNGQISGRSNVDLIDISSPWASLDMATTTEAAEIADNLLASSASPAAAVTDHWDPFGLSVLPRTCSKHSSKCTSAVLAADSIGNAVAGASIGPRRPITHVQQCQPPEQVQRLHHLQAPQLRQQLEELSFSQLSSHQQNPVLRKQQQQQQEQQQQQQQAAMHDLLGKRQVVTAATERIQQQVAVDHQAHDHDEHDWCDFQSSPLAHDHR